MWPFAIVYTAKKYFKLRLGSIHGTKAFEQNQVNLQRVSMNLFIGGDLVDLIAVKDKNYIIKFGLPSEIDNNLQARLVIQTANKVKQVVFGCIEGSLNSLLALSNNKIAKLWIDMNPNMSSADKREPAPTRISDAKNSQSKTRLGIFAYTGSKDSTELNDVKHLMSPESESEDPEEVDKRGRYDDDGVTKDNVDIRYLMPGHMPKYLRIDNDIKNGLYHLTELMKEYSNFDVLALERDVTRTLELELDK